ncbi:MAG TPA: hypothetical protein ENN27_05155 [Candidatus Atribacteria bacterium]|nr:hypothetical protein [Candidatus Atribacteria bacterium]
MDWTKVKSIFEEEEKKYDWESLKAKFEPEKIEEPEFKSSISGPQLTPYSPEAVAQQLKTGTYPTDKPILPQQLQDIAKIMPEAEEPKKEMGLEYVPLKVYSVLAEKHIYATGELSANLLKRGFNAIGLKNIGKYFEESEEIWKQPPVTKKVQQHTAYLREQAYKKSFTKGIVFDISEATTQLMGLLIQMAATKKIPAFKGEDIYTHLKAIATHAVVTTPGSLEERIQAALYRIGYSITPFIVNNLGATGLTAVATDTLLNTFLTSPTYAKALKQTNNIEEFLQIAIPQLVMDIGMAWNTRGLPEKQREAMINKYIKTQARKIGATVDEYKKAIEIAEGFRTEIPTIEKPTISVKLEPSKKITPEAKPTTIPKVEVKEPWQMTKEEFSLKEKEQPVVARRHEKQLAAIHKAIITNAIEKGKPVPAEVLADYPELKVAPKEPKVKPEVIEEISKKEIPAKTELPEKQIPPTTTKPEKLITPEGTVTGKAGSIFIPSMADVQNVGTKIASKLSIEAPFIKAGAKETGFQVKNYFSNIGIGHEQGLKEINTLNKFKFKVPTVKESGFKASGEIDYTDITYLSERPEYFIKLTSEERKLVSPAKKSTKDFYKRWEEKLKEIGWMEEPFPQSLITRNNRTIGNLKASLPKLKTAEARAKAKAEIARLQDINDRIKKQKIQFVSIPARTILAKVDTDPVLRAKIMSILPHWGRTTITVKDLVDKGIITRQEADIRYIIGEYSDRMGRKYALGKIFENAEKEGLIKSQAEKPDWPAARIYIKGQHVSIPQLRGKRLDPFFSDVITDFFSSEQVTLGGVLGITKMMAFHNPVFLPMYDVWQSAAIGALTSLNTPKYIITAFKDSFKKTDNYWIAFENGLFSKPFAIPYDKFEYQFTEAMKGNKLGDFIKKAALPTNWIPMLYTASWHTAWKLDETIRMISFNYLKDKGYTDREAAQLAALYHSDYACYDEQTEVLTRKGWKKFKDLYCGKKAQTEVLTFNMKTDRLEYQHIKNKFVYNYDGKMYHWNNKIIDLMVNPGHKLLYYQGSLKLDTAENLYNNRKQFISPSIGKWKCKPYHKWKYNNLEIDMDIFVKFMGIYLSEGSLSNNSPEIRIHQKEPREDFQIILDKMPMTWKRNDKLWRCNNKILHKYLKQFGKVGEKYIPNRIKGLPSNQIKIFIDYYTRGDGFDNNKYHYIYSKSKRMIDDLQELAIKAGYQANVKYKEKTSSIIIENGIKRKITSSGGWIISFRKKSKNISFKKTNCKIENYKGKIYSVEIPNRIICVRRNGKYCFSGNSVPPSTRKVLNKIFFTPTFKITMGKLYLNMLKGSAKVALKIPAKAIGKEIKISKEEKNLARGGLIALGIMTGIGLYFKSQGYKEEEKFRKYVKTIETDEGMKENVITLANPFNIPWRYYYRVKGAFKPQTTNVAGKLINTVKWDLHPLYRVASDVVENYNWQVYNPFDNSE